MKILLSLNIVLCSTSFAQTKEGCIAEAFEILKNNYGRGINIFNKVPSRQDELKSFIKCDTRTDILLSLETVVHEAIHFLDEYNNLLSQHIVFHLINDSTISVMLSEKSLQAIQARKLNKIYNSLSAIEKENMGYADNYLKGANGNQDFFSLLGELNAYANGLDASIHLPRLSSNNVSSTLAGPLAMVVFALRFYEHFEKLDTIFFNDILMDTPLREVVKILIDQALRKVTEGRHLSDLQLHMEVWEQALQADVHQRMLKTIVK